LVVVTGATGHIGNVLVKKLVEQGEKVRVLILPSEDSIPINGLDVERVFGDVLNPKSLSRVFEGADTVFHLAGIISIMPGKNEQVRLVNVEGTNNVIKACKKLGIKRLVYTSSIHALKRTQHGIVIDEKVPFDPENPFGAYDRSKAEASLLVRKATDNGLNAVIVCPTGVIGPFDFRRSEMGQLIQDCSRQIPQLYVEGAYDFVDVRDVAIGLILASKLGITGETYILSGHRTTIQNLMRTIEKITEKQILRIRIPIFLARIVALLAPTFYRLTKMKPHFTPYSLEVVGSNSNISHAKATKEFGYKTTPFEETLKDTVKWFKENRHVSSGSKKSYHPKLARNPSGA